MQMMRTLSLKDLFILLTLFIFGFFTGFRICEQIVLYGLDDGTLMIYTHPDGSRHVIWPIARDNVPPWMKKSARKVIHNLNNKLTPKTADQ